MTRKAENQLAEEAERYRDIITNILDVIIEVDAKGKFIYLSPQVYDIFGFQPEELIGSMVNKFIHPEDLSRFKKALDNVLNFEESLIEEFRVKHKDGNYIQISAKGSLVKRKDTIKLIGILRDITKSKKTEYKLKESEKKYRGILENIKEGYYEVDLSGNLTFVNDYFCKTIGYSKEELLGNDYRLIFDESLHKGVSKMFSQLYKTATPLPHTNFAKLLTKRGKQLYLEGLMDLIYDTEGKKVGFFGLIRDVSERKQAEQKLKEFETKYKGILENIMEGYYEIDLRGNFTFASDFYCKVLGFSKEDILGKNATLIFDEKSIKNYNKLFAQLYKTGISFPPSNIIEVSTTRGKKISFEGSADLIYDSEGNRVGYFGLARDVSERIHAEQKLKESEHKLEGRVKELNCLYEISKTIERLDVSFEEIIQDTLDLIPPACQFSEITCAKITYDEITYATKNFKETKWKVATDLFINEKLMNIEVYYLEERPFVKEESNLINDIGQRLKIIFERKKVEEELRELSRLKSEFLRRASHELKTPLISIKGFSDLILSLYSGDLKPDVIIKLKEILHGCERLQYIINDLLQASRLDATDLKPKTKKEDLSFLIKFCVNELRSLANSRNQSINLEIQDEIITIFEKEEIYDVLSNLLTNAIKYTLPSGKINVKTEILEDSVIVSVKDNGIGFTDNEKLRIFKQFGKIERFGQGHDLGIDGTGLGLYISKKIVESHNGRMWMESEGKNKGSTFSFSLPKLREP